MTHSPRGTCNDPVCSFHGVCHCGCGRTTKIADKNNVGRIEHKGMPRLYAYGHNPRCVKNLVRGSRQSGYATARRNIPIERVQPLLSFLVKKYGDKTTVARVLSVNHGQVSRWTLGHVPAVKPWVAARISAAVLAVQPIDRPHRVRQASTWESARADRERARHNRYRYRELERTRASA